MSTQVVRIPMALPSVANLREHWGAKASRASRQRWVAATVLRSNACRPEPPFSSWPQLRITLTRIQPRQLDSDNLASAFKAVRDGVADWLGVDDGNALLTWCYEQRKSCDSDGFRGVQIEVKEVRDE